MSLADSPRTSGHGGRSVHGVVAASGNHVRRRVARDSWLLDVQVPNSSVQDGRAHLLITLIKVVYVVLYNSVVPCDLHVRIVDDRLSWLNWHRGRLLLLTKVEILGIDLSLKSLIDQINIRQR